MTQGINDLINAIVEGDATAIDAAFNAEMANRVSSKLEDMRVRVAQNMFKAEQVEEVAEEAEDEEELTEEEIDSILDAITEEDLAEINKEEQVDEATLSSKAARAGKDIGKPGKSFHKIAAKAGKKYGSKEAGERVAGAILAKMRAKHGA
jgi:hypothetical protein